MTVTVTLENTDTVKVKIIDMKAVKVADTLEYTNTITAWILLDALGHRHG